jgi:cytochrome c biogenesis protein CcmG/thiol:disulfide interchange protein DsbE
MRRTLIIAVLLALVAAACSSTSDIAPEDLPPPPTPTTFDEVTALLETSQRPVVINVWASWCLPCRSEAPLISTGSLAYPDVDFIGLNVRDNPTDASKFMAEFLSEAKMTHLEDRSGNIPVQLGATKGVPITFFYRAGGELAGMHLGIIDEPTLARFLDEIDR